MDVVKPGIHWRWLISGKYVYLDCPWMDLSAAERLVPELYNKLLPFKTGPYKAIKILSMTVMIDEHRIRNNVSIDWGALAQLRKIAERHENTQQTKPSMNRWNHEWRGKPANGKQTSWRALGTYCPSHWESCGYWRQHQVCFAVVRLYTGWRYSWVAQRHTLKYYHSPQAWSAEKWHNVTTRWSKTGQQEKKGTEVADIGWKIAMAKVQYRTVANYLLEDNTVN